MSETMTLDADQLLLSVGAHDGPTDASCGATDWLVRIYTPAWLRLAGLTAPRPAAPGEGGA